MKRIFLTAMMMSAVSFAFAQKYMTRTGKITFFSSTPVENIEAFNNEVAAAIDAKTGEVAFQVPVKSFKFEKSLMQDHFNENYMESDKYPKSEYKGKVADINKVNLSKDGSYDVKTTGKLTMHGVTKEVSIPGTLVVKNGVVTVNAKFTVKPADYNIKIPGVVENKIAKDIEVTVNTVLKPM